MFYNICKLISFPLSTIAYCWNQHCESKFLTADRKLENGSHNFSLTNFVYDKYMIFEQVTIMPSLTGYDIEVMILKSLNLAWMSNKTSEIRDLHECFQIILIYKKYIMKYTWM